MGFENIIYELEKNIGTITINRPQKLNALNQATLVELDNLLNAIMNDSSRIIIITGYGEKAFVAGADIQELHELNNKTGFEFALSGQRIFSKIENLNKPVIAAVNGFALGGGCELAAACHIRIASENAKFGQPEVKLGTIPGYGGTQRLARLIGTAKAIEYSITGDLIDAYTALNLGLVNKVVPFEKLIDECRSLASKILNCAPLAVNSAIKAILSADSKSLEEGLKTEARLFGETCSTDDFKEGTKAFLEKRNPVFKNK
ncbi:MAG: enoyl-CoA hydratase/isomerase family protein [Melioribacteraceae bacterium]|nr:enoyl-CoA hydratase/isomerase family protein [Melioribacteraceae bacterium]